VESGVTYLLINLKMAQWMGRLTAATLAHDEWAKWRFFVYWGLGQVFEARRVAKEGLQCFIGGLRRFLA
jgi:hypothetical protein